MMPIARASEFLCVDDTQRAYGQSHQRDRSPERQLRVCFRSNPKRAEQNRWGVGQMPTLPLEIVHSELGRGMLYLAQAYGPVGTRYGWVTWRVPIPAGFAEQLAVGDEDSREDARTIARAKLQEALQAATG
jgi:hypothetical protein